MNNIIYNLRPIAIMERVAKLIKPLGYTLVLDNSGTLRSIKKGTQTKPCPYFYRDKRNRIRMKMKCKNNDIIDMCIDKETNEWLAYYIYKEIIK